MESRRKTLNACDYFTVYFHVLSRMRIQPRLKNVVGLMAILVFMPFAWVLLVSPPGKSMLNVVGVPYFPVYYDNPHVAWFIFYPYNTVVRFLSIHNARELLALVM